jgi:glycosyltransferase involved in cell wall biosynthesis
LRILHIITGLKVGGAETVLKRLVELDDSNDVVIISLSSLGVIGPVLRSQGKTVHALNMSSSPSGFIVALWQLRKLIRHYQPQIVQTWMYHSDFLGALASYLAGQRNIVWNIRTSAVRNNKLTIAIMRINALLSHWLPKKIVCVAEAAKQMHIDYGYDAKRMVVIHNGFDFANFTVTPAQTASLRQHCGFAENEMVIGCVGRFHPDKGQENFVKAAAIVVADYPQAKFLLVGRDCDANNEQLMAWLTDRNLEQYFVLLGERDDIPVCLSAMTIFCMPSSNEGFPNALAEAMAMGLPCVATDIGDAAILGGGRVTLIPAQDEQALASGLSKILNLSAEQRQQMGQCARERVLNEFTIKKARASFNAVYQQILDNI